MKVSKTSVFYVMYKLFVSQASSEIIDKGSLSFMLSGIYI